VLCCDVFLFFFFSSRRRHTRWPRDWSSDVCSSDLPPPVSFERQQSALATHPGQPLAHNEVETLRPANVQHPLVKRVNQPEAPNKIGRASCREREKNPEAAEA